MPTALAEIIAFLDRTLEVDGFRDYGPNGLQVEGRAQVERIVTGVTVSLALLERAAAAGADLVVVHHGLIWGGGLERITGAVARRVGYLLSRGVSLAAYHLPLDAHPRLGNNAGLADALGLPPERRTFGDVRGRALGVLADLPAPIPRAELSARLQQGVLGGGTPQFVFPHGPDPVRRVGLCSGAASDLLEAAAREGCDAFVTGELAERVGELARELHVTLLAAGHYRTEVYGPSRLAHELGTAFPGVSAQFIDVPSPL